MAKPAGTERTPEDGEPGLWAGMEELEPAAAESLRAWIAQIAHDIKNPLASISMGVDFLTKHVPRKDRGVVTVLLEMREAVKRTNSTIQSWLKLTQKIAAGGKPPASGAEEEDRP